MPIQTVNIGSYANDSTGDDLRTAFEKVNANFALLDAEAAINNGANVGVGIGIFDSKDSTNLQFKSLTSLDNSVVLTTNATTINLKATPHVVEDTNPKLGGNLDLQNYYVYHGDIQTTVYGYDVPSLAGFISMAFSSNQINLDLGTVETPSSGSIDFNGTGNINFIDSASNQNDIDFGTFV